MPEIPPLLYYVGVLAAVVAIGTLIFKLGKWVQSVNNTKDEVVPSFKRDLDRFMKEMRDERKEFREDIKKLLERLPATPVMGSSPLRLTELGQSMSESLDARAWAERTAQTMVEKVSGMEPYEVQEFCFDYMKSKFNPTDEQEAGIKRCAYDEGLKEKQVRDVMGIELRDALLALRKTTQDK